MSQIVRARFTFFNMWASKTHPDGSVHSVFSDEANRLLDWLEKNCSYVIMGYEHCPTTGRPHFQGYCEFNTKQRMSSLMSTKIGFKWNVLKCDASAEDNEHYCSKEGNVIKFGKARESKQGKRSDLDRMRTQLSSGGLRAVVEGGAGYQAIRYAEKVVTYCEAKRNWQPLVLYIQGEPGSGKSSLASDIAEYLFPGEENKYTKSSNNKWFDGYDAHPVVILDDWRDSWWPLTEALAYTDRYECRAECKGGSRQFRARVIIMTSVKDFPTVYEKVKAEGEPAFQFRRRFDRVITLTSNYRSTLKKSVTVTEVAGNNRAATLVTGESPSHERLLALADSFVCSRFCARTYDPKICLQPERSDRTKYTHFEHGDHSPDGPAPSMLTEDTIKRNVGTRIDEWVEDEFVYEDD